MSAIAAPKTEKEEFTSASCKQSFTAIATAMESAAREALPIPVRQAASVSTPASDTADTDKSLIRFASVRASVSDSEAYKSPTILSEKKKRTSAHGTDKNRVSVKAYSARILPSSSFPREKHADTEGTDAVASPVHAVAGNPIREAAPPESSP